MAENISTDFEKQLLKEVNDKMMMAVMPVTVFVGVEAVLGFIGNLLVIFVFVFRYKVCNFRFFVLCLAFADFTASLTTMPGEVFTQLNWYAYPCPIVCKIKSFFNIFTVCIEAFGLCVIAFDRYLKVCRPFGFQIKPRLAWKLCVIIYIISAIVAIPVAIYWGTHTAQVKHKNYNVTVTLCEIDQTYLGTIDPLRYSSSVTGIVSTTLVIMFIFYTLVSYRLIKQKQKAILMKSRSIKSEKRRKGKNSNVERADSNLDSGISRDLNSSDDERTDSPQMIRKEPSLRRTLTIPKVLPSARSSCSTDGDSFSTTEKGSSHDENHRGMALQKSKNRSMSIGSKVRRKTKIMFILTVIFIITTSMYLTLLSFIASGILDDYSDIQRAVYFFFFRFYFINHIINPVIYGILDPRFRNIMTLCRINTLSKCRSG